MEEVFPEVAYPAKGRLVCEVRSLAGLYDLGWAFDVSFGYGEVLSLGVKEDELAYVPGEAVLDAGVEGFTKGVLDEFGIEGVSSHGGVGHLNLARQDRQVVGAPVEAEIVPSVGAWHLDLDGCSGEGQLRVGS